MKLNKNRRGCKDVFHAYLVKEANFDGIFDIPIINGTSDIPNELISFSKAMKTNDYDKWVHFYEDDCQIERIWNQPRKYLRRLRMFNGVILPDFSLYRDMPLCMQVWNIYRSRALGHWLENSGIKVIVNYRVGDERTFDIACTGINTHAVIAVGTVGCMDNGLNEQIIINSIRYAIDKISPAAIVFYGKIPSRVKELCYNNAKVVQFEGETATFHNREEVC